MKNQVDGPAELIIDRRSFVDRGLRAAVIDYIREQFTGKGFIIETIELPEELGTVPCRLWGPAMGDAPVSRDEVTMAKRGDRPGLTPTVTRKPRQTRTITIIAGPYDGDSDSRVLYTAFAGALAPREPWDPDHPDQASREGAREFWSLHALSAD